MRKISAHYVFTAQGPPLRNGIITINDLGEVTDIQDTGGRLMPSERLEHFDGILTPGFVNAHTHLELSHLKNDIPPGTDFPDFLRKIVELRKKDEESVTFAAKRADREMFRNGIVAAGDISNDSTSFPVKRDSPIEYHTFIELTGLNPDKAPLIMERGRNLLATASELGIPASITPHAAYSVSDALVRLIMDEAPDPLLFSVHHLETEPENEFLVNDRGVMKEAFLDMHVLPESWKAPGLDATTLIQGWFPSRAAHLLLVHNVWATRQNIAQIQALPFPVSLVLCPSSNLHLGNVLPNVPLFRQLGLKLCLGTDSYASNTSLSILKEMQILQESFPTIPLQELICWASLNGAEALQKSNRLGSIEVGKKPGINWISNINYQTMALTPESCVARIV